ncbi:hypothetical protein F8388_011942 [Cannabis sativa]|uniref:Uncharacterized protein n=1 Tax=Cannabis sativa TaxID=3483 RepID=A0A7J6EBK0_CANSA|nr:hypothetical protein G4B88_024988 [Cannabis sativa]KAF4381020.1 hypothetical protein F8388_011942 [Cannabis sativa]
MEIGDSLLKITLMELVCSSRLHSASRNNLRRYRMNYRLIKNESDSKFDGIEVLASLDNDVFESIKLAKIRCLLFCLGNWVLTTDVGDGKRSLISEDRDSGVAFEMHLKLLKEFLKDLASLKRANDLSSDVEIGFMMIEPRSRLQRQCLSIQFRSRRFFLCQRFLLDSRDAKFKECGSLKLIEVSGLESLIYLFVCTTTSTHWMDLLHLQQFLKSKQHESPQETIQALDVVLRDAPSKLFFHQNSKESLDVLDFKT